MPLRGYMQSSRNFRENIRSYNGALSLASRQITGNMYRFSSKSRGPPVFKMCGQMYHLLGPVLPENGEKPKFSQLYVYDRQNELGNRIDTQATKEKLDCSTMKVLQENLHNINFYVQQYQQAADILTAEPSKELRLIFKAKETVQPTRCWHFGSWRFDRTKGYCAVSI